MADRARQRIAAEGFTQAEVVVSDASAHDLSGVRADLLFSRFGVMFFADPTAAFTNLRRAMRPGGRLLFACWRPLADNPWFRLPLEATRDLLPPQPPQDPHAPGPYAFADADRVGRILRDAGWHDVGAVRHDVPMRLAGPGETDTATAFATRVGPLGRLLAEVEPAVADRARHAVKEVLRAHDGPEGIVLGGSIWLISAKA
jgi:SAM-dependent methyltransferase